MKPFVSLSGITLKTTHMTKQQMIDVIKQEEKQLWEELQDMLEAFGVNDKATESATTRWATISFLMDKLELK
jgi:hypothetical protein